MNEINIPITFETFLKVIDTVTLEQKHLLRQHLDLNTPPDDIDLTKPQVTGLHKGTIETSDDSDKPIDS